MFLAWRTLKISKLDTSRSGGSHAMCSVQAAVKQAEPRGPLFSSAFTEETNVSSEDHGWWETPPGAYTTSTVSKCII